MTITRGWQTALAILAHGGSSIEDRGDHLVIRTPSNPTFHWGNFLLVTDDPGDRAGGSAADHWVERFALAFPQARHVAIGLPALPDGPALAAWTAHGIEIDTDDVLAADTEPQRRDCPPGYRVKALTDDADWAAQIATAMADNALTGEFPAAGHEEFLTAQAADRRALCERGLARWFGAFTENGDLAADLGIVLCDRVARYQSVGTVAAHRGRGLAGHLLGVAAHWAGQQGATSWVIVTETSNPAGRLYRSVGFEPDAVQVAAYRRPAD